MPYLYGGPCCCCRIFHDDFNRDNSPGLGNNWTEALGVWSIASNQLVAAGTSSEKHAICDVAHPGDTCSCVVQITITSTGTGAGVSAGLITNYVDEDNYSYALVSFSAPGTDDQLSLYNVVGGAAATLEAGPVDIANSGGHTLKVCHNDGMMVAECEGEQLAAAISGSGDQVGVLAVPVGPNVMAFDDFTFWRHKTDAFPDCPECSSDDCTYCEDGETSPVFKVVFGGTISGNACSQADCDGVLGTYILKQSSACEWKTDLYDPSCGVQNRYTSLLVGPGPSSDYYIEVQWGYGSPTAVPLFRKTYASKPDCDTLLNEELTLYFGDAVYCGITNVTCKITALP